MRDRDGHPPPLASLAMLPESFIMGGLPGVFPFNSSRHAAMRQAIIVAGVSSTATSDPQGDFEATAGCEAMVGG